MIGIVFPLAAHRALSSRPAQPPMDTAITQGLARIVRLLVCAAQA